LLVDFIKNWIFCQNRHILKILYKNFLKRDLSKKIDLWSLSPRKSSAQGLSPGKKRRQSLSLKKHDSQSMSLRNLFWKVCPPKKSKLSLSLKKQSVQSMSPEKSFGQVCPPKKVDKVCPRKMLCPKGKNGREVCPYIDHSP